MRTSGAGARDIDDDRAVRHARAVPDDDGGRTEGRLSAGSRCCCASFCASGFASSCRRHRRHLRGCSAATRPACFTRPQIVPSHRLGGLALLRAAIFVQTTRTRRRRPGAAGRGVRASPRSNGRSATGSPTPSVRRPRLWCSLRSRPRRVCTLTAGSGRAQAQRAFRRRRSARLPHRRHTRRSEGYRRRRDEPVPSRTLCVSHVRSPATAARVLCLRRRDRRRHVDRSVGPPQPSASASAGRGALEAPRHGQRRRRSAAAASRRTVVGGSSRSDGRRSAQDGPAADHAADSEPRSGDDRRSSDPACDDYRAQRAGDARRVQHRWPHRLDGTGRARHLAKAT